MIHWDPAAGVIDHAGLEGLDAVVHLAGEKVGTRWSDHRKRRIRNSRIEGTLLLAEALAGLRRPPRVLVSASAMGVYGNRGDEILTEASAIPRGRPPTSSSSSDATGRARPIPRSPPASGWCIRDSASCSLRPAAPSRGCCRRSGSARADRWAAGRQWVSWISMDDAVGAMHHALLHRRARAAPSTPPRPDR